MGTAFAQTPFRDTAGLTQNGIEWCEENYQLYQMMGNDFFEHHHHSIESRLCGNLYNDGLWFYTGYDRYQKLIEQSRMYYNLEIQESFVESKEGKLDTKPVVVEEIPQVISQQQKELENMNNESESNVVEPSTSIEPTLDQNNDSDAGGCLIATATYGSELAPQVQQLREFRDNKLLQTDAGSLFMTSFNEIYYSFSPTVADYERKNPVFKEIVKVAITPMISSLSILNNVDMDSETKVLGYGISLILLNLGMYVGIPSALIVGIRRI
ncbi:hypothetical protein NKOR_02300 [Candidatus Nitrosopumilus koreensis AR1]|uniref:Uncharacterized protein n=1 Tax=Candidatus Nitrosopumilus koreensis AR1 TaxID=1229908 RepID=K0B5Z8_9ARCH|nr:MULTISPECIES: CFI-box-CTERM domain-containing protein [Nitrosopumilus]AFS80360.1 hypothetical protein NKOR_02300 [Candidatus Nitrosopumilus koreensis AR1]